MFTKQDVMTYVEEENVKFIRLAFFDIFGTQKNISILSDQLERAFNEGISFDASGIAGFSDICEDLFLHPEPSSLSVLPWRPSAGSVVRMFCVIKDGKGNIYENDSRYILKKAVDFASENGFKIDIGAEMEFYLFKTEENGEPTKTPLDFGSYMDIAPLDKGENIRREICLTLKDMEIDVESSHHQIGPGQNEISFKYGNALYTADNTSTFKWVVKTVAARNGLFADFSPKPLDTAPGNGMHVNISITSKDNVDYTESFKKGILKRINDITLFLNCTEKSYERLGRDKAPNRVTWSNINGESLIRIPQKRQNMSRIELRSPDASCNPYLAFALLIYAGVDEILNSSIDEKINNEGNEFFYGDTIEFLPKNIQSAFLASSESEFVKKHIPSEYLKHYK